MIIQTFLCSAVLLIVVATIVSWRIYQGARETAEMYQRRRDKK